MGEQEDAVAQPPRKKNEKHHNEELDKMDKVEARSDHQKALLQHHQKDLPHQTRLQAQLEEAVALDLIRWARSYLLRFCLRLFHLLRL